MIKNKKADAMMNTIILLVVAIVGFIVMINVFMNLFSTAEDFSESGYLCLATLKLKDLFSAKDSTMGVDTQANLIKDRCTTIKNELEVFRTNVPTPRNESNKQQALSKKIADRMGYVWWMTGQGNLGNMLDEKGISAKIFGGELLNKGTGTQCVIFMDVEIVKSKYHPKGYDMSMLLDYLKKNSYSIEKKDGEKYDVSYYDYITSFSTEGNGGLFVSPFTYFGEGSNFGIAVIRQTATKSRQKDEDFINFIYYEKFGAALAKINPFDKNKETIKNHFNMNFKSGVLDQQVNVDGDPGGFFMILATKQTLQNFGCKEIKKGVKT